MYRANSIYSFNNSLTVTERIQSISREHRKINSRCFHSEIRYDFIAVLHSFISKQEINEMKMGFSLKQKILHVMTGNKDRVPRLSHL